ncbi:MAG: c-type cytochrome [Chloroflexi bacterium]|nr:c-type cytochrome [Chloroflexota bacterium]
MKGNRVHKRPGFILGLVVVAVALLGGACANVSAQEIKGILEAADGKVITIKTDDGSTVQVTVTKTSDSDEAKGMVGQPVTAKVQKNKDGEKELVKVTKEDHGVFFGVVKSVAADKVVVGDKTFRTNADTKLDKDLEEGATVKVTFSTQPDGFFLASELKVKHEDKGVRGELRDKGKDGDDDDDEDKEMTGVVKAVSADSITVGDKTFKINPATEKEGDIKVGATVKVEFVGNAEGIFVAREIEAVKVTAPPTPTPTTAPPPTTAPTTTPPPTTTVAPVSYAATVQPLFNQYCASCHGASAIAGVDLRTHASTMASGKVTAGNAQASKLYKALNGTGAPQMPPTGAIPAAGIQAVADWINQGALNN